MKLWQEIATDLVLKYIKKFYLYHRDQHDAPYQEYRTLKQILSDEKDTTNAQFLRNLRVEYLASIDRSRDVLIGQLHAMKETLERGKVATFPMTDNMEMFRFDNHLYQPLIHIADGEVKVSVKPAALNNHERRFCEDLEAWIEREASGFLSGKEFYLLRNQSRGKGISFFAEGNFYPDFICWIVDGPHQHITFLDPHGLRHARGFEDAKIQFHHTIKEIEQRRLKDPQVTLESWIISPTRRSEITHWSDNKDPGDFLDRHVVFMYDDPEEYCHRIFCGGKMMKNSE